VLDVGCGVGITAALLVRQYGCRVVGLDVQPALVARAVDRARQEGVAPRTAFQVGDAQALPCADNTFDAALAESVIAFVPDPQRAVDEMVRVTRAGGCVAFTEAIWFRPPPPEMADFMARAAGLPGGVRSHDEWRTILERAGLQKTVAHAYPITTRSEARDQFRRLGLDNYLRILLRAPWVAGKPTYRELMRSALRQPVLNYFDYMGYGVYVGRKP
jgi:SAM-dependent methyltransferase